MLQYIELFGQKISTYGILAVVGMVLSLLLACYFGKMYRIPRENILACGAYGGFGLIIGAKLFFAIPHLSWLMGKLSEYGISYLVRNTGEVINIMFGGFVFYGGFIGMIVGIMWITKVMHWEKWYYFDILALVTPFFHAIGRVGCFLAGCCYGKEYHGPWAVQFPKNPYDDRIHLTERLPVQLLESGCNMILFFILLYYRKMGAKPGSLFGRYLISYSVIRFVMEMMRADLIRGVVEIGAVSISFSQCISIVLFCTGLYVLKIKEK